MGPQDLRTSYGFVGNTASASSIIIDIWRWSSRQIIDYMMVFHRWSRVDWVGLKRIDCFRWLYRLRLQPLQTVEGGLNLTLVKFMLKFKSVRTHNMNGTDARTRHSVLGSHNLIVPSIPNCCASVGRVWEANNCHENYAVKVLVLHVSLANTLLHVMLLTHGAEIDWKSTITAGL